MTEAELLNSITAAPDDDLPRLVYADWLEERDDAERAELIRAQCELARLVEWDPRAKLLRHRVRVLLARNGARWAAVLPALDGVTWGTWSRGFVSAVSVPDTDVLARHQAAIRAAAPVDEATLTAPEFSGARSLKQPLPWLRTIRLAETWDFRAEDLQALLDGPLAPSLRALVLGNAGLENAGATMIADAKQLSSLRELDLTNGFVGAQGALALAHAPQLARLEVLRFGSYGSGYVEDPFVTDEAIAEMAGSSLLTALHTLDLGGNRISSATVRTLLSSPRFASLRSVSLQHCNLSEEAFEVEPGPARWRSLRLDGSAVHQPLVERMAALAQLSALEQLSLAGCGLDAGAISALSRAPMAATLRELRLGANRFGADGARALAAGRWPALHTLDLANNDIAPDGMVALANGAWDGLLELRLERNAVGDRGIAALAAAPWARSLRRLGVRQTEIEADGARLLASAALPELFELDLSINEIGPAGAAALGSAAFERLTDLDLTQTRCGDAGIRACAGAPWFAGLLSLRIGSTGITADGLRAIVDASPTGLRELNLDSNTELGADGVAVLTGGALPALAALSASYCNLQSDAIEQLVDSELGQRVRQLQLNGNRMSPELHERTRNLAWRPVGPDWVGEDGEHDEDRYY